MTRAGYEFASQTDTEVIAHLIHSHYQRRSRGGGAPRRGRTARRLCDRRFCNTEPGRVVGARYGSPLVIGLSGTESFLRRTRLRYPTSPTASCFSRTAISPIFPSQRQPDHESRRRAGRARGAHPAPAAGRGALGPYRHFMQKEIFEQPLAVAKTFPRKSRVRRDPLWRNRPACVRLGRPRPAARLRHEPLFRDDRQDWFESIAKIPTQVEISSEYRYRETIPEHEHAGGAGFAIGRDRRHARRPDACAVAGSRPYARDLQRRDERDGAAIALVLHHASGRRDRCRVDEGVHHPARRALPARGDARRARADTSTSNRKRTIEHSSPGSPRRCKACSRANRRSSRGRMNFARKDDAIFLGRGSHYPIAHGRRAEAQGNLVHPRRGLSRRRTEARTARARDRGDAGHRDRAERRLAGKAQVEHPGSPRAKGPGLRLRRCRREPVDEEGLRVIQMPEYYGPLSPILHVLPFQLLAYHTACTRGTDVDKPRNLAKSVTVE